MCNTKFEHYIFLHKPPILEDKSHLLTHKSQIMSFLNLYNFYKKYRVHLIAWSAYIIYEVFITGLISKTIGQTGVYIIVYILNISIFYLHSFFFKKVLNIPRFILKIIAVPLLVIGATIFYTLFAFVLWNSFIHFHFVTNITPLTFNKIFFLSCIWRSLYFIGFSIGYVFILKSFEEQQRADELEKQNLINKIEKQTLENDLVQSQNNYLRSQINPHFLFNTLNFIYNDARKKAPLAADAIMNLAEMMRYALKRPEVTEMVPLNEEVEQIEHLINLHKLRTAGTINFDLEVEGDLFGIRFPPLILLTLVENMFKHGNVSHSTQPAKILIRYDQGNLTITTINMINDVKAKESTYVGIDNINKRLGNFFNQAYSFNYYKDQTNHYITEIKVEINNPMKNLNS